LEAQEGYPLHIVHVVTMVDDDNERPHRVRSAAVATPRRFTSTKIALLAGRFLAPVY
jgi:hypothetical protein